MLYSFARRSGVLHSGKAAALLAGKSEPDIPVATLARAWGVSEFRDRLATVATVLKCALLTCTLLQACFTAVAAVAQDGSMPIPLLEEQLLKEDVADLAKAARQQGDPSRGAILFYQPYLTCTKCHSMDEATTPLGPDLTKPNKEATDTYLVEAVLQPSSAIKKGYEPMIVITDKGKSLTGLLVEEGDAAVVLRDPAKDGELITIPDENIDDLIPGKLSVMPAGLTNGLANRQQFLDLVRYLMEIAEKGPQRARQLEPPAHLYALPPIPEYEKDIDHAGMIADLDDEAFQRGRAVYERLCVNCHGTKDQPGSLPTSLRFASGTFKHGFDPHTMYETLTKGYGMMMPQTWMVPQQKYDVIHYIREAYLKEHNPTQYARVDPAYLDQLPEGTSRGPEPTIMEPWVTMDYGPNLNATYEVGSDGTNFAYKGIAVRLDPGPGGVSRGRYWMLYEHDTLRVAAAWSGEGFIDWNAIMMNGRHGVHPRVVGQVHMANPTGPGWANPADGSFADVRLRGRDDRRYGPLPRQWARYKGTYHYGNRVILAYTVGEADILEMPGVETGGDVPVFTRTFNIGPRRTDLILQVARHPRRAGFQPAEHTADVVFVGRQAGAAEQGASAPLHFDGKTGVQVAESDDFDLTHSDYTVQARIKTRDGGTVFSKTQPAGQWVPDGKAFFVRGGKLVFDIGWVGAVSSRRSVDDGRWHDVAMTYEQETGRVRLYVDGRLDGEGRLRPKADVSGHVVRIGYAAPNFPRPKTFFEGQLDHVAFYARAMSEEEIAALVSAGGSDDALVARWQPADSPGSEVRDRSGNGHDGRVLRGAVSGGHEGMIVAGVRRFGSEPNWQVSADGNLRLRIAAGREPLKFVLWSAAADSSDQVDATARTEPGDAARVDLEALTRGGPLRWPERLAVQGTLGQEDGPFAVDVLTHPARNPWLAQTRFTGFDFFPDGTRGAVCSWDGDVWMVRGVDQPEQGLTWQRIASGMFQPLGLKIVDGQIYVACRDQICILRDKNGDGETDFYECFNSDHQVTEHFHEFAMGLQTDDDGNFYYAKGARHAKTALVPQHGTLLRVSKDGQRTDILARGFRAPNGVCINPDRTLFVTDQEGHWMPKNRINLITAEPRVYGNHWGYHDLTDSSDELTEQPICWITNSMDRSPAELVWVDSDAWGPLNGTLLNTSYGYGMIYTVPHETIDGRMQGGVCPFPLKPFPTGIMRPRFHPQNGQLYVCGMFAWAGNQHEPGGFFRVRYTGKPVYLPVGLQARKRGIAVTFSSRLDRDVATDTENYAVQTWTIRRSAKYGSDHYNEERSKITGATLSDDGKSVFLEIPDIHPTRCMEVKYWLRGAEGEDFSGTIHNTIHELGSD
jgi:putative heme-binding domain-containing protein